MKFFDVCVFIVTFRQGNISFKCRHSFENNHSHRHSPSVDETLLKMVDSAKTDVLFC